MRIIKAGAYLDSGYRYLTKHGLGPGTLPRRVKLLDWEDLDNYMTAIYVDKPLTSEELDYYDIYPEWIQSSCRTRRPVRADSRPVAGLGVTVDEFDEFSDDWLHSLLYQIWDEYKYDELDEEDLVDILMEHCEAIMEDEGRDTDGLTSAEIRHISEYARDHYYDYDWE